MADSEAVLFANEAFYPAFSAGDVAEMDALWSRDAPVACIHPGWEALSGRSDVMASWRAILREPLAVVCREARAYLFGDLALVVCYEALDEGFLVATNVFVREGRGWKMVHHQAGPTVAQPPAPQTPRGILH